MNENLKAAFDKLSPIQKDAANWDDGAALVLAGPGAGKTRVLTSRIARLLENSPGKKFRILALTFTTKAAKEMRERVEQLVPGMVEERTFIGTYHAFCTNILRQHGSHIGYNPDFSIFGQKEDQEAVLLEALQQISQHDKAFRESDLTLLSQIKYYKSRLITPEQVYEKTSNKHLRDVYELYEASLRRVNALDFDGLIFETCRLFHKMPAIAARLRKSYPYWLIDEFQDTNIAQYKFIHYLAGSDFRNIFAVADDDQIIYQWQGASYKLLEKFRTTYTPELIQLVENHRCPPEIVEMANKLVAFNTQRAPDKVPIIASRSNPINAVSYECFETDTEENERVSELISQIEEETRGNIAVLARNRALLDPLLKCLHSKGIKATLLQRRDNFVSPQFVWLQCCLDQILHPTNKRIFGLLVNAANRMANIDLDQSLLIVQAETIGQNFIEYWAEICVNTTENSILQNLGELAKMVVQSRNDWKKMIHQAVPFLLSLAKVEEGSISDADEDFSAWDSLLKEIKSEIGQSLDLNDLVQGIELRSKEPPIEANAVALMTIHSSKGLEFDTVFIIGLAEREMPSWQSCEKGDASQEMEEERRSCFVAITRTKERLFLTSATKYRERQKSASRFLNEMFPEKTA